jgi:hypothetical protein
MNEGIENKGTARQRKLTLGTMVRGTRCDLPVMLLLVS